MNIFIKILPLLLCIIFLVGCEEVANHQIDLPPETTCPLTGNTPPPTKGDNLLPAGTDIYYTVLSASDTECTVKILTMSCSGMTFGEAYYIEKEVDGVFTKLEWKTDAYFIEIAYLINSDQPVEKTYKWENYFGKLEKGKYRIVTDFYRNSEKITAYFEFEI